MLLGVPPAARTLSILIDFHETVQTRRNVLALRISELVESVEELRSDLAQERATESGLRDDIGTLQDDQQAMLEQIAELETRLSQMDDGYKHRLQEVRGRMRGMLEGGTHALDPDGSSGFAGGAALDPHNSRALGRGARADREGIKMVASFGLDFGTTNSLVAYIAPDPESGTLLPNFLLDGGRPHPSVVWYGKRNARCR